MGSKIAAKKMKIHKKTKKHEQLLSSLYVYRPNMNYGVRNENPC